MRVVVAHGTFDLLHSGHIAYLQFARNCGDKLVVALASDKMASLRKGKQRPIRTFADRKITVEALRFVDECIETPYPTNDLGKNLISLLDDLRPAVFASSYPEFQINHGTFFDNRNIQLVIAPVFGAITTTGIITKILKAYDKAAA